MFSNENWGEFGDLRGWHGGHRAKRGDMKPIILRMLLEKPMYGYEIISRLEEKSHGMWRPSAGSVYPNLQLLDEQDLVTSEVKDGKKIYSLTTEGKTKAEKVEESVKAPWEEKAAHAKKFHELKFEFMETMGLL
ncbi:MAG TPA: PadR family transcriptional regulator, partial [Candidatus Saccharimonadales bacterium]|nr:PadR family transcriptional regulator [Candidatus Saccharimonadales bacterium]